MNAHPPSIDEIYLACLEQPTPEERAAYLDEACLGVPAVRERVERLLRAQAQVGSFLESPAPELCPPIQQPAISAAPGNQIGPYKLLQQIGEGGMGIVYVAEQLEPIRRKVALKVIKPGMDTRQVIARFEAEQQALAGLRWTPIVGQVLGLVKVCSSARQTPPRSGAADELRTRIGSEKWFPE